MKEIACFLISWWFFGSALAQDEVGRSFRIGVEGQQYPTGILLGVWTQFATKSQHAWELRLGYNNLDHKDFGRHGSEKGAGFGVTVGHRYYFRSALKSWFGGFRTDLWFNRVEWEDMLSMSGPSNSGVTKVMVLQPTLIAGYQWPLGNHFILVPSIAFGAEINVVTRGEDVGQGAIILWGLNFSYRF